MKWCAGMNSKPAASALRSSRPWWKTWPSWTRQYSMPYEPMKRWSGRAMIFCHAMGWGSAG